MYKLTQIRLSFDSIELALLSFDFVMLDGDKLGLVFETTAVNRWSTGTPDPGSQLAFGLAANDIPTRFALLRG